MARSSPTPVEPVEIDVDGKAYKGSYLVHHGTITVEGPHGRLCTHVGPEAGGTARMLIREIVDL